MKEMNSDRHSCIVSLASFAILALPGSAFFMMRLMLAIGRKRSCSLHTHTRPGEAARTAQAVVSEGAQRLAQVYGSATCRPPPRPPPPPLADCTQVPARASRQGACCWTSTCSARSPGHPLAPRLVPRVVCAHLRTLSVPEAAEASRTGGAWLCSSAQPLSDENGARSRLRQPPTQGAQQLRASPRHSNCLATIGVPTGRIRAGWAENDGRQGGPAWGHGQPFFRLSIAPASIDSCRGYIPVHSLMCAAARS